MPMLLYVTLAKVSEYKFNASLENNSLWNISSGVGIRLDSHSILALVAYGVLENDILNYVVALAANATNAEAMAVVTVHPGDCDTNAASDSHAY